MLAAIQRSTGMPRALASEHECAEEARKLQALLVDAKQALDQGVYSRALWALRSAYAMLLDDFRRREHKLPLALRMQLLSDACRVWREAQNALPEQDASLAAMCAFIERQHQRASFFAC